MLLEFCDDMLESGVFGDVKQMQYTPRLSTTLRALANPGNVLDIDQLYLARKSILEQIRASRWGLQNHPISSFCRFNPYKASKACECFS